MLVPITPSSSEPTTPSRPRIVTDSNAMLTPALVERFEVLEVPLTIVIDGTPQLEPEVDLAEFYDCLRGGKPVSTAAPSPGEILAVYDRAVSEGATEVLSIHVGSNQSGTVNSARIAAEQAGVPVTIVDTGAASFIEGCCVWAACDVMAAGGTVDDAARRAEAVAAASGSVFTIGEIARAIDSGRVPVQDGAGVPIFATAGADMDELARATSEAEAVTVMTSHVARAAGPLRVGVGHADANEAADLLERALRALPQIQEVVRYVVGPSVAAHTGVGTFGAVFHAL